MPSSSKVDVAVSGTQSVLRLICEGATGCGLPGLEGAAKVLLHITEQMKKVKENDESCKTLLQHIDELSATLRSALDTIDPSTPFVNDSGQRLASSLDLSTRLDSLMRELGQVRGMADTLKEAARRSRFLKATTIGGLLKEMADRVKAARDVFAFSGQVSIETLIRDLTTKSRQEALERNQQREAREWDDLRNRIPHADAGYSARVHARHGRLLPGTRTDLLQDLDDWATSAPTALDQSSFFVLTGGAGAGESTIAFDVARRAETRGHLGASFFFMRGAASLDSTDLIFPTLAWQLLANVPGLRSAAVYSVVQTHLLRGGPQNMDQQAEDLFVKLLSTLPPSSSPIVIVVDAVDECSSSTQDFVQRMLFLIMQSLSSITCIVRVFVTSRPEVHIEDALRSLTFRSKTQRFRLHDIPRSTVDHDIRLFFINSISQLPLASRLALSSVYGDAAGDLTERAAGLFIYAAIAVEYLKWFRGDDILEAMKQILARDFNAPKPQLARLDELYTIVLNSAFPSEFLRLPGKAALVDVVLSSVAVLKDHVSPRVLAVIAGLDLDCDLLPLLHRLAAVLSFDPNDADVIMRPLHASFPEFLVDPARSISKFWVDASVQNCVFTGHTLNLLRKQGILVSNICRMEHPGQTPAAVVDLRERIASYLPPPVRYACLYWPAHVASIDRDSIPKLQLESFCVSEKFVYWLEALGYLRRLDIATQWLPSIRHKIGDYESTLSSALKDGSHVVRQCGSAILANPYQLYISGLPLCPGASPLRRHIPPLLPALHLPFPHPWALWTTTHFENTSHDPRPVRAVARSDPNGRWIAVSSAYNDGRIHLCDPATGTVVHTIVATTGGIRDMDLSSSGRAFVTVSPPSNVEITDSRSGSRLHSWQNSAAAYVGRVAFVLKDTAVVLVSAPDIMLWDLRSNTTRPVRRVGLETEETFPFIAIGSKEGPWAVVVRQKYVEVLDLRLLEARLFAHGRVSAAEFLSGNRVLLRDGREINIHDVVTGEKLFTANTYNSPTGAASISWDGSTAAFSGRNEIHVWDRTAVLGGRDVSYVQDEDWATYTVSDYVTAEALSVTPTGTYILTVPVASSICRTIDTRDISFGTACVSSQHFVYATAVSTDLSTVVAARHSSPDTLALTVYRPCKGTQENLTTAPACATDGAPLRGVALSDDGRLLIVVWNSEIRLWDDGNWSESFVPSYFDSRLRRDSNVWTARSAPPHTYIPPYQLLAAALSPGGKFLLGLGIFPRFKDLDEPQRFGVIVWNVRTKSVRHAFTTSFGAVRRDIRQHPVRIIPEPHTRDIHLIFQTWSRENVEFVIHRDDWDVPLSKPDAVPYIPMSPLPEAPHIPFCLHPDGSVTRNPVQLQAPTCHQEDEQPQQTLCWISPSYGNHVEVSSQYGPILVLASDSHETTIFDLSAFLTQREVTEC